MFKNGRKINIIISIFLKYYNIYKYNIKELQRPGLEPGSTAWKAAILTTRLTMRYIHITNLFI